MTHNLGDETPTKSTSSVALAGATRSKGRAAPTWQHALVLDIIVEAPDAVTLRLQLETSSGFLAGQYYNVRLSLPERPTAIQRAYSVGSSPVPDPSIIELGVREVPGGLISPRLVGALASGDRLEVRGPFGRFAWSEDDGGPLLLVGAGSGVVPLMSMIRYGAASGLDIPMRLVSSSSSFDCAFYHRELDELARRHPWLEVAHSFTRDHLDPRAKYHRRIDRSMIADALVGQFPERAYLCGPPSMVESVEGWLSELGVDPSRVHTEKYD
ncbi:MAG: FAD-binding oxidoreductase [Acidimicrobiales bacterium]